MRMKRQYSGSSGCIQIHWNSWPRIDDAIASYQVFTKLRRQARFRLIFAFSPVFHSLPAH